MCYLVCGMVHIKEPLLLNGKSSPCGGSGFPLSLSEWSFTICDRRALQQLVLNVHVKHTDLTCEFLKSHMRSDEDRSQTDSRSCKYFTTGSFPHLSLIYKMNRQCYFTREHVTVEPRLWPVPPASVCIIKVSQKWNNSNITKRNTMRHSKGLLPRIASARQSARGGPGKTSTVL